MALRRDSGACADAPDVLTMAMAGVAAIPDPPRWHTRQLLQQRDGMGQFMRLAGAIRNAMAWPEASAITQALVP
jgi:hypothetical protein